MIKALNDTIIFSFVDRVYHGTFVENSESGLYLGFVKEDTAKAPRFGIVKAIGPKVTLVKVGDKILIDALMWTDSYTVEGVKYWNTNEEKVLAIQD